MMSVTDKEIGEIIEKSKAIEYYFNNILHNFILPQKNVEFFRNVILHTSIIPLSSKFKLVRSICEIYDMKPNFDKESIYRLLEIRNIFAHQSMYEEHPEGTSWVDEFKGSGKYTRKPPKELYDEFNKLYDDQINKVIEFSESIK